MEAHVLGVPEKERTQRLVPYVLSAKGPESWNESTEGLLETHEVAGEEAAVVSQPVSK